MPTVTPELVQGHQYQDTFAGFEILRVFHVRDLVDAPNRQLIEAVHTAGIPLLGETYPGTFGINCVRRTSFPAGENAARVECAYSARRNNSTFNQPFPVGNDGKDVKQITTKTRELTTTRDIGDNPMVLNPPTRYEKMKSYLSEAKVLIPSGTLVFERVETSVAAARARTLVGRVNSTAEASYAARTLLFDTLESTSNDGGYSWDCTYEFLYDIGGWKHRDRWKAQDGRAAQDADEVEWDVLLEVNFSSLGLDFSDSQTPIS